MEHILTMKVLTGLISPLHSTLNLRLVLKTNGTTPLGLNLKILKMMTMCCTRTHSAPFDGMNPLTPASLYTAT